MPALAHFPLPWQAAVVSAKLREACPSNADEIEEWVDTITPFLPGPCLSSPSSSEAERNRVRAMVLGVPLCVRF